MNATHRERPDALPSLVVCPRCRSEIVPTPIVYGYPSSELMRDAQAGQVRLGGCLVGNESPEFACPACDGALPFASDPYRRGTLRSGSPHEQERDELLHDQAQTTADTDDSQSAT